jgi:hypothetical protein
MAQESSYPAKFSVSLPDKVANWRPLVNWVLVIPQLFVLYVLRAVAGILAAVSWFYILFTGSLPDTFTNFQAMYMRYELRTYTFWVFMEEEYPPFGFEMTPGDPGDDPRVHVEFTPQLTDRNRVTTAFRIFLIIPHLIVLFFLGIVASVLTLIAFFAVLFTGRWPKGMQTFALNVMEWYLRVQTYYLLLTDEYPPFSLTG